MSPTRVTAQEFCSFPPRVGTCPLTCVAGCLKSAISPLNETRPSRAKHRLPRSQSAHTSKTCFSTSIAERVVLRILLDRETEIGLRVVHLLSRQFGTRAICHTKYSAKRSRSDLLSTSQTAIHGDRREPSRQSLQASRSIQAKSAKPRSWCRRIFQIAEIGRRSTDHRMLFGI